MYNYEQFKEIIAEKLQIKMGNGYDIKIHEAIKTNDHKRYGVTIYEKGKNFSPNIFLENFFKQYEQGDNIDDIVDNVIEIYHNAEINPPLNIDYLAEYEKTRGKIVYQIINYENNQELLKNIPYVHYLDFAIVFYIMCDISEQGTAIIKITKDMANLWNVSAEELFHVATENSPKLLPAECKAMHEVIKELMEITNHHESDEIKGNQMYVLTNFYQCYGACVFLYKNVLEDIGKKLDEDFYILPSSVHETLILPVSCSPAPSDLNQMIAEINETQVAEEEVLSDHCYYYNRELREVIPY